MAKKHIGEVTRVNQYIWLNQLLNSLDLARRGKAQPQISLRKKGDPLEQSVLEAAMKYYVAGNFEHEALPKKLKIEKGYKALLSHLQPSVQYAWEVATEKVCAAIAAPTKDPKTLSALKKLSDEDKKDEIKRSGEGANVFLELVEKEILSLKSTARDIISAQGYSPLREEFNFISSKVKLASKHEIQVALRALAVEINATSIEESFWGRVDAFNDRDTRAHHF